jgi:hypothetical protein
LGLKAWLQLAKGGSTYFTIYFFQRLNIIFLLRSVAKVHSFYTVGMNLLKEYIATNYPADVAPGDSVPVTNQSLAYGVGLAT